MEHVFARSRHSAYPVVDEGRVVGIVSFRSVAAVPASDWDRLKVGDRMQGLEQALVLDEDDPLADRRPGLDRRDLRVRQVGRGKALSLFFSLSLSLSVKALSP